MDWVTIGPARQDIRDDRARITFDVTGLAVSQLWFEVDRGYRDFVDDSCDAAVAALLVAAMIAGKSIRVGGPVSMRLLWSVRNILIPVVTRQLPLPPIGVEVDQLRDGVAGGDAVLTGLSCGVDSFSVLQELFWSQATPVDHRVTHLVFSHVGHHGLYGDPDTRAGLRWARARDAAAEIGLPILRVTSNSPHFYPLEHDHVLKWQATLTLRNSSVPLFLQRGVRRFLMGSGHTWEEVRVCPTYDQTLADPILLSALSTESVELSLVGAHMTRVQKTRAVSSHPIVLRYLDVCIVDGEGNCSKCSKCLRTLLTLDVMGRLGDFADRFDVETYRFRRNEYIAQVLTDPDDPYQAEIRELMEAEAGYRIPLLAWWRARFLKLWRLIPHDLRRRLRGLPRRTEPGSDRWQLRGYQDR